jgi:hypothetical protein
MKKMDGFIVRVPDALGGVQETTVNLRFIENSSNVYAVGWDDSNNMFVRFHSGGTYLYYGVSRQRAVATAYAKSVGQYINRKIKPNFEVLKLA